MQRLRAACGSLGLALVGTGAPVGAARDGNWPSSEARAASAWSPTPAIPEVLGTSSVGEPVYASPALANGRIFIRGERHLFAIGR